MNGSASGDGEAMPGCGLDASEPTPANGDCATPADGRRTAALAVHGWRDYASAPLRKAAARGAAAPESQREERTRAADPADERRDSELWMTDRRR